MRLKPSGLRCVDISGNFNAVFLCYSVRCLYRYSVRFCGFLMLFCTVFIPVFLCGFAVFLCYSVRCLYTGISERFCDVRTLLTPPPPLLRLLSDLKFYYMHVKVSILKPILVFSSMPPLFQDLQTLSGSDVYLKFVP